MQKMESLMNPVPDDMYETLETFLTPINYVMATSWVNIFMSLIVGVITGLFVKRNQLPKQY